MRFAQRMKSRCLPAMACIFQQQQRLVEKHLLGLGLGDAVLLVLAGVAVVPVKAGAAGRRE